MSLNLALVISGEASGAKAAADQTATAVRTVGVAAAQTSAAMTAANDQAVASAQRVTAALVGQTVAQRQLQAGVERMISAGTPTDDASYRQRAADIAAYGASLDRVRATYDPLFAAQTRYKAAVEAINQAERTGAISASLAIEARLRETASLNSQISALNGVAAAQKSAAQSMVDRVSIVPDRGADIAAYGNSLDALRAKYNPLFAAEQEHLSRLQDIDQALKVGAISEIEHANAAVASGAAYQRQIAGLGGVGNAAKLTSSQLLNLSRQGNDVITMFALGAPPMMIFASQAGQIYDALEQGPAGIKGSLLAIGESILSLVTKFPLATAAIGATGVALIAYKALGIGSLKALDDILAEHEAHIKRLGDAYDQANVKRAKYAADSTTTVNALDAASLEDAKKLLQKQTLDVLGSVDANLVSFDANGRFAAFAEPIKKLMEQLRDGVPDIKAFRTSINEIANADPRLNELRKQILDVSSAAADTASHIPSLSQGVSELADTVDQFNRQIGSVTAEPIRKALQDIFDKAKDGEEPLDQITNQIAALQQANPSFSGIIAGFTDLITKAYETSTAIDSILQSGPTNGRQKLPVGILPDTAPTPDERPNAEDIGAANDKRLARAAKAANPYRDILKSAQDRIDQMKIELQLTGQVGVAADTLRNYQELLGRATDHGREIGEKQKAELKDRAAQMAELAEATAAAKVQQDLLFDRQQMFRSAADQEVYSTLRSANIDPNSATGEAIAQQIRYNEQLKETRDLAGDFVSTLVDGLRNGENLWQSMGDAALSVLDKITDKLLNEVLDAIFQISSAGGGGGSILGAIGSLFGLGGGGSAGSNAGSVSDLLSSSWSFDTGGYTGPGPRNKPAGVVHAGEVVFSQDDIARAGGVGVVEAMRLGRRGYATGGVVEGGMAMPATGTYGGGPTWSGASTQPQRVVLHIVNDEGPMFRTTIRQESQDVAVQVVRGNDQARADYYDAGGNPR